MNTVSFKNPGEIDVRSIKSFGVSAKETDNPIGYFGTGLKYAIAIFLRSGHRVSISSGLDVFEFSIKRIQMRGKDFDFITMNGEEMPFTTELGKNWELWQAFREVYCNCIDEKGWGQNQEQNPEAGHTVVHISGPEVAQLWADRGLIVLDLPKESRVESNNVEVWDRPSKFLYYRGIRVLEMTLPSLFTYNIIGKLQLTEDRTLKDTSEAARQISFAISGLTDKRMIRKAITAPNTCKEGDIEFSHLDWWQEKVSEEFHQVLEDEFKRNNDSMNKSAIGYLMTRMRKNAAKHYEPEKLTTVEEKQLDRCVKIASSIFPDFLDYEIMVVKSLGQSTMALADADRRAMVISKSAFQLGTKYLLSTLIEEYTHLKTGFNDCTRQMQTHLFDTLCTMIENHVIKEPV